MIGLSSFVGAALRNIDPSCKFWSLVIRHPKDPQQCVPIEETFFVCQLSRPEQLFWEALYSKPMPNQFNRQTNPMQFDVCVE